MSVPYTLKSASKKVSRNSKNELKLLGSKSPIQFNTILSYGLKSIQDNTSIKKPLVSAVNKGISSPNLTKHSDFTRSLHAETSILSTHEAQAKPPYQLMGKPLTKIVRSTSPGLSDYLKKQNTS